MINHFYNITINNYIILFFILLFISFLGVFINTNIINKLVSSIIFINVLSANFIIFANYIDGINLDGMVFAIVISFMLIMHIILFLSIILWIFKIENIVDIGNEEKY